MKKISGIFLLVLLFSLTQEVSAARPLQNLRNEIKPTIAAIKEEAKPTIAALREQTKEEIKLTITASPSAKPWQIRNEVREQNKGLLENIKNQVKEKLQALRFNARLTGKITEVGEGYLKVSSNNDGKVYQVNITDKTQLRRHFWGKSTLAEFSVGDEVNVIGRYTDETKSTIEAVLIRNNSIQRRWGVFFGEVLSKTGNTVKVKTINRGELDIYIINTTRLVDRQGRVIALENIQIGHRIRVKGVWDKSLNKVIEVEEVKDFSLPQKAQVITPTATSTPTP
jgi:hypothetical protein